MKKTGEKSKGLEKRKVYGNEKSGRDRTGCKVGDEKAKTKAS